ncbi:MAG: hypothetical protein ACI9M9_002020 [Flavobacteriaceae bacterium]|jgi:hypothetical protein
MKLKLGELERYLKKPYPYYYYNQQRLFLFLLLISIFSFSFSYFFEPFDVNLAEHKINSIWILLIHAFIPFPIAYLYFSILNRNGLEDKTWTLRKELLSLSIILLIIGIVGFLIRDLIYTNPYNWSLRYFWEEIRNTFLVGFLFLIIVLPLNLERLKNKHESILKRLSINPVKESKNILISLKDSTSNESFELNINEFIFAKVESNYTEIHTFLADRINKKLIRITLKELEEQLKSYPYTYKTHRSYLVNLNAIKSISGNAQGYHLLLKNCSIIVPVSRSKIVDFNAVYSKI